MIFDFTLGLQTIEKNTNIINRQAVRAVIINKDMIFMVHTNKGDYKFPGGGVNKEETHEGTLEREIKEETGYFLKSGSKKIGIVVERNIDKFEKDSMFEMVSHYYLCEISSEKTVQQLDDYEEKLGFHPIWINIDKAIEGNEQLLKEQSKEINPWVARETRVLKAIGKGLL